MIIYLLALHDRGVIEHEQAGGGSFWNIFRASLIMWQNWAEGAKKSA